MKNKFTAIILSVSMALSFTSCGPSSDSKTVNTKDTAVVTAEKKDEPQNVAKDVEFEDISIQIPEEWSVSNDETTTTIKPDDSGNVSIIAFYSEAVPSMTLDVNLLTFEAYMLASEGVSDFKGSDAIVSEQPAREIKYMQTLSGHNLYVHGYIFPVKDRLAYIAIAEKDESTGRYSEDFSTMINNIQLPGNSFSEE